MQTKATIVIGLGVTGQSVVRHLLAQGEHVIVCDTRDHPPDLKNFQQQFPQVIVYCGALDATLLKNAKQLIVSPGVATSLPAINAAAQAGIEVLGDVELFLRQVKIPIIAITGSNGKTTVTTLVGEMAKAAGINVGVGGNIGMPVLDLLVHDYDLYVLELSSFQLETTYSLHAIAAVVLNVSDNHMDRYTAFSDYVAAKQRIYYAAKCCVINLDNPTAWQGAKLSKQTVGFTINGAQVETECFSLQNDYLCFADEQWITKNELSIQTKHHIANLLAAFALCTAVGIAKEAMLQVARNFVGIPHRCQKVIEKAGIIWFNDSKATTVAATTVALENIAATISGRIILIAGGDGKGADFSPLSKPIANTCRVVILLGRDAAKISGIIPENIEKIFVKDLSTAVEYAAVVAQAGDAVLLSPACASLDMFKNFVDRGEQFMTHVMEILNGR